MQSSTHRCMLATYNDRLFCEQESEWLLRSTDLVLGDRENWFNGTGAIMTGLKQNSSSLPPQFASHREYIIHAESVMKSWLNWISSQSKSSSNSASTHNDVPRMSSVEAAKIVETILKQTLDVYSEWEELKVQNNELYLTTTRADLVSTAIYAWVKCQSEIGVDSAASLLRLLRREENGQILTYANEESYHAVIKACISSKKLKNLEEAIKLLDEMQNVMTICSALNVGYDEDDSFSCVQTHLYPSTQTYNLVLYGLAHCNPCAKNAKRAEKLLQQMTTNHKSECFPESNTFRQLVSAWAKSGSKNAVENAHGVLKMMLKDFPSVSPDVSTYNALMTLYLEKGETERVLELFDEVISNGRTKPDSYSMNLMLRAKLRTPSLLTVDKMNEIEDLLLRMKSLYHVRPTCQSFNVMIDGWAKSGLPESANRAEALLDMMEKRCRGGDLSTAPDAYSYTSVLNAISRDKYERAKASWAEHVLQRMEMMHEEGLVEAPTTPVYNAVLNVLITSSDIAASKVLFAKMGKLRNTRSYNIMIKSYSSYVENSDGTLSSFARPSKAKALLYQMEQSNMLTPDVVSYTTVICAYSRSNVKRKAMKAFGILRKAIDAGIKPSIYTFNGVLTACAHTYIKEEKVQAFTILVSTLIMIRQWTKPDDTTYRVLLKACERLLPVDEARKKQVLGLVFRELEFQCDDPDFHASMMEKFMTMDGGDREPLVQ